MTESDINKTERQAQSLFERYLDSGSPDLDVFLRTHCSEQPEIAQLLQSLITSHNRLNEFDASPLNLYLTDLLKSEAHTEGIDNLQLGRYRVVSKLGEGGSGAVFLCQHQDPNIAHQVAVKVLREHLHSDSQRQRFIRESHILSRLKHPNIAAFIDAGHLDDHRPFVVMEYTPGLPIDAYCNQHQLDVSQRVQLFLQLCEAVEYAHRQLIVHRDIKPANVVVNAQGQVKLLDFGIAKVLDSPNMDTRTGAQLMTPAYASPEQILGEPVGTASDVYSLGVVLFELLTGQRPFEVSRFTLNEYRKQVMHNSPPLASQRVLEPDPENRFACAMSHRAVQRALHGDLDRILAKAIQSDPEQRYAVVADLINDIENHRAGRPVKAHAPGMLYRSGKFFRRNALASAVVAVFVLMTVLFIARLQSERNEALREQQRAETISQAFIQAFKNADPTQTMGKNITARQIMDQTARLIQQNTAADPVLAFRLSTDIAEVYNHIGETTQALDLLQSIESQVPQMSADERMQWTAQMAQSLQDDGQSDQALALFDDLDTLSSDASIDAQITRLNILLVNGQMQLVEEIIEPFLSTLPETHPRWFRVCTIKAQWLNLQGAYDESTTWAQNCVDAVGLNKDSEDIWQLSRLYELFARNFQGQRQYEEANRYLLDALKLNTQIFGDDHISQVSIYNNLAWNIMEQGDLQQALTHYQTSNNILNVIYPGNHPSKASTIYNTGHVYSRMERYDEALQQYQQAIAILENSSSTTSPKLAFFYKSLGYLLMYIGRHADAIPPIDRSIELFDVLGGTYRYRAAEMRILKAHILHLLGDDAAARTLVQDNLADMYVMHPADDEFVAMAETLSMTYGIDNPHKKTADSAQESDANH